MTTRGKVVHADVPDAARSWPRALDPLFLASNALILALNAPVVATARVRFRQPIEPIVAASAAGRALVFVTWHRFNYACIPAMRALPMAIRPTLVMHDGLASRALTHEASAWMGFETFVFQRRSQVSARTQIIEYVRSTRRPILNLPDSGGPYGEVKPGIVEVASACDALVVPFVVTAEPAVVVGRVLRHVLPLPFATIEVVRAAPLEGKALTRSALQRALDDLTARASLR